MNQAKIQQIRETAKKVFSENHLDYKKFSSQIVPLNQIFANYPLMIIELPNDKTLSTKSAIRFLEREIGFEMPDLKTDERKLSGFIYVAQYGRHLRGCIFTDKDEPTVRRRFSAAHELGHYLLHFSPRVNDEAADDFFAFAEGVSFGEKNETDEKEAMAKIQIVRGSETLQYSEFDNWSEMELEANQFAAELLMPEKACRNAAHFLIEPGKNKKALIRKMATDFLVSYEAMKRRLEDLELLQRGF